MSAGGGDSARDAVLGAIRSALGARGGRAPSEPAPGLLPARAPIAEPPAILAERFAAVLGALGAGVRRVRDEAGASAALRAIAGELGAREVALSDSPLVARVAAPLAELATFDGSRDRARLLSCDLGVSAAQLGIAETGTLVLVSSAERHRLVSLVPPVHVALLRRADLVPALGDALRAFEGAPPSLLTFVTGPSRTADIELTLVVGVHGPRALFVILIEDDPAG